MDTRSHTRWLLALAGLVVACAHGLPTVTGIPELRALSPGEAAEKRPAQIESQVVRLGPTGRDFFIYSGGAGAYVQRTLEEAEQEPVKAGDWVRITGTTHPGEFYPALVAGKVEVLRSAKLPPARPFRLDEIYKPASDCDWVAVEGRLIGAVDQSEEHGRFTLVLEMYDSVQLAVNLPVATGVWKRLPELMFRRVRFNAVVGTVYNNQRQQTGRVFFVNTINDFELIEEEGGQAAVPTLPIHNLMRVDVDPGQRVRTQGTVTHAAPNEIYLRGEEASLRVATLGGSGLELGQRVEVEGFVWPQPISPAFRALVVRVQHEASGEPEPMGIQLGELFGADQPEDLLDSRMNYELVRIRAQLVDTGKSFGSTLNTQGLTGQQSLLCRSGTHLFEARLPFGMEMDKALKPGATLELTGICHLMQDENLFRLYFDGLWLQVRDARDIVVLNPAPWWTPRRLLWGLGIVVGGLVLSMLWILALHRTVNAQTNTIGKQIERETTLNERQRIARELHDTLEQGLTALSMQLRRIARKVKNAPEEGLAAVDTAEKILRVCREESRASIQDLRGGLLEDMDLPSAVKQTLAKRMADTISETGVVDVQVKVEGAPVRLTLFAEHQVLRLVTEAASNALQHASPSKVEIGMAYCAGQLEVEVADDGCGFDLQKVEASGRFGLQGMHERANRLHGQLGIETAEGRGTRVRLSVPVEEFIKEASL